MFQPSGGFPECRQLVISTGGSINGSPTGAGNEYHEKFILPAVSTWVAIQTRDNPVRVYFRREDFDEDARYLRVTSSFSAPAEVRELWFRAEDGDANIDLLVTCKG